MAWRQKGLTLVFVSACFLPSTAWGQVDSEHACGDCHGPHTDARGGSALVRSARSELTPQAPGIGAFSLRCLQCHGTQGDRRQAVSDRPLPLEGALYLGSNLNDDHKLGHMSQTMNSRDRLDIRMRVPIDGLDIRMRGSSDGLGMAVLRPDLDLDGIIDCDSCHESHDPWSITQQTTLQADTCLTCHDPSLSTSAHGVAACGSCHRMHAAQEQDHLGRESNPDYLCGACHQGAPQPSNTGIEPVQGLPLHSEPSDLRCSGCHSIH